MKLIGIYVLLLGFFPEEESLTVVPGCFVSFPAFGSRCSHILQSAQKSFIIWNLHAPFYSQFPYDSGDQFDGISSES
jgi:hypothetical protein